MKCARKEPLFPLEELKDAIARGEVELDISQVKYERLVELIGDANRVREAYKAVCSRLTRDDFAYVWGPDEEKYRGQPHADVYGIMADLDGGSCDCDIAWYLKIGRNPRKSRQAKAILSFHPTEEIVLNNGIQLRSLIDLEEL